MCRLPATYQQCARAIEKAVDADAWIELGRLVQMVPPGKASGGGLPYL